MNLLIFGGGRLQISIIRVAKKLGIRTVVIDPNPNAEAKNVADTFEAIGGQDFDGTMEICEKYSIDGIITSATDKPLEMMARVAEARQLLFPSLRSIQNTINKCSFKQLMLSSALPVARGIMADTQSDKLHNLYFPVIVKPIDNSGSRGVIKVSQSKDLNNAIMECLQYTSKGEVLVEEFIEGDEISVEGFVMDKKVHIIQITDKKTTAPPYNVEIEQLQPSKYSTSHRQQIQQLLQSAIDILGLDYCALHPELKINGDGVFLIEIGPRLGGDYITSHLVPLSTGINIEELMIRIVMKMNPKVVKGENKASMIKYFQLPVGKKIPRIDDWANNMNDPSIHSIRFDLKEGETIKEITNSINRYGNIILAGNRIEDLRNKAKEIENNLIGKINLA